MRKITILIFCASVAAIAIGKPKITNVKYDVNFIYCLSDSKLTYSAMEELSPAGEITAIKGVNSKWARKDLLWCIENLYNVNSSLWEYYLSTDGLVASTKALAVLHAISINNANFQSHLSEYAYDCTQQFATDTSELKKSYDKVVEKVNQNDSSNLAKLRADIDQKSSALQSKITGVTTEMTSLRGQIEKNEGDVKSAIARVESLQTQLTQLSLSASLNNQVSSFNLPPICMPIASIADSNFTNAIMSISKYLGAENEVNTNGVTFVPPNINGNPAPDVIAYLNSKGVVGYSDGSSEETNRPFTASFTLESNGGTNTLTAPFIAPANWADGSTIKVNESGQFYAEFPTPEVTTPWHWDGTNGFLRPFVYVGNNIVTATGADVSAAGDYYVHVSMTSAPGGGFNISAVVNTSGNTTDDTWTFWVGTLASVPEDDGQGGITTKVVCTAELGVMPVILCYE